MGLLPDTQFDPADSLAEKAFPSVSLDELEKRALEQRPDLQGVALQQAVQADGVRAARASFGPRLNAITDWEVDNPTRGLPEANREIKRAVTLVMV